MNKYVKTVIIGVPIAIILALWTWWMCCFIWQCDYAAATLVLEDEHSAVWMTIDNAFTGASDDERFSGVLFQFGNFVSKSGTAAYEFETITITSSANTETYGKNSFKWINVVPHGHYGSPPSPPASQWVSLLFPDPDTPAGIYECEDVDECLCQPAVDECADCEPKPIPEPCLRLRSLRPYFEPFGVLTYWQGNNGYKVKAEYQEGVFPPAHTEFTFLLKDPVDAYVWKSLTEAPEVFTNVAEIRVTDTTDSDHGEIQVSPIGSGTPVTDVVP